MVLLPRGGNHYILGLCRRNNKHNDNNSVLTGCCLGVTYHRQSKTKDRIEGYTTLLQKKRPTPIFPTTSCLRPLLRRHERRWFISVAQQPRLKPPPPTSKHSYEFAMSRHPTLIKPPSPLPHHAPIESALSLLPLSDIGPDIFTNARPLWHPPGARGIFGGVAIAQCLAAAQATIPAADFTVHSMHCYFVLAGNSSIPILYHVERVRDGRSFITRTVQARQRGKCIFTTTISFVREGSAGPRTVEHHARLPEDLSPPPDGSDRTEEANARFSADTTPFEQVRVPVPKTGTPESKRVRQWLRARGRISNFPPSAREGESEDESETQQHRGDGGGGDNHQAHLSALAYMTDSYFIGTVARVHNLTRFSNRENIARALKNFQGTESERIQMRTYLEEIAAQEEAENRGTTGPGGDDSGEDRRIGMMVSLDHAIFFHNPRAFRADEWMLQEMESPWAGDGRGLVIQRIWSKDGVLIATCTQEGLVRLQAPEKSKL